LKTNSCVTVIVTILKDIDRNELESALFAKHGHFLAAQARSSATEVEQEELLNQ
jgi:hypothetical protein